MGGVAMGKVGGGKVGGGKASAGRMGVAAAAALAPAMWGTTYLVTTELLPDGRPMLLAALRALPAGLLLLLLGRKLPRGRWWGRAAILGMLNIGFFFPLIFVGAYHLPGGVAATIGAIQPLLVIGFSAMILGARPSRRAVIAGLVGVVGVGLLVLKGSAKLDGVGIAAMLTAIVIMALGTVLTRKWGKPEGVTMLDLTAWQLTAGGLFLAPLALVTEGAPRRSRARTGSASRTSACSAPRWRTCCGSAASTASAPDRCRSCRWSTRRWRPSVASSC